MSIVRIILNIATSIRFPGSSKYWDMRYRMGGNSGAGSYGAEAAYKAEYLGRCFAANSVRSVIDFGCGDGNQLLGLDISSYDGYDVSSAAIERCRTLHAGDPTKRFHLLDEYDGRKADATISLDVLYHLVEQDIFDAYLQRLFGAARNIVIIYAIDCEELRKFRGAHVRHRNFTKLIEHRFPTFRLMDSPPRPASLPASSLPAASFFVYRRESMLFE